MSLNKEFNIKNMTVNKNKNSAFLEEIKKKHGILHNCAILRILESGNYYIYTFRIDFPAQKEEIKKIQDEWI